MLYVCLIFFLICSSMSEILNYGEKLFQNSCYDELLDEFLGINETIKNHRKKLVLRCEESTNPNQNPVLTPVYCLDFAGTMISPNTTFQPSRRTDFVARCKIHESGISSQPVVGCLDRVGRGLRSSTASVDGNFQIGCVESPVPNVLLKCLNEVPLLADQYQMRTGLLINCSNSENMPVAVGCKFNSKFYNIGAIFRIPEPYGFTEYECKGPNNITFPETSKKRRPINVQGGVVARSCIGTISFKNDTLGSCRCEFEVPIHCVLTDFAFQTLLLTLNGCGGKPYPLMCRPNSVWNETLEIWSLPFWREVNQIRERYNFQRFRPCGTAQLSRLANSSGCECFKSKTESVENSGRMGRGYVELFILLLVAISACVCGLFSFGVHKAVEKSRKFSKAAKTNRRYYKAPMHYVKLM